MIINNLPDYAFDYRFIVYSALNGEKWFYGAYNELAKAINAMNEIGGMIAETKDIKGGNENGN